MFAPHPDQDTFGTHDCLLWKVASSPGILVVLFDEVLVFAGWPSLRDLILYAVAAGVGAAVGGAMGSALAATATANSPT